MDNVQIDSTLYIEALKRQIADLSDRLALTEALSAQIQRDAQKGEEGEK